GSTFLVQIMNPGAALDDFDLVALPRHDRYPPHSNVIETIGAPHRVTQAVLAQAHDIWMPRFEMLPSPRLALIVGGSTKSRPFTTEMAQNLGQVSSKLAADAGGSLLVSTSRRTGDAATEALMAELHVPKSVFRWDQGGDNPYLGYLAIADAVLVTGDSMSMCTEACATTTPVYIYAPRGFAADKHRRLHQDLYDLGYARPLGETLVAWTHPPLNPAEDVARAIRERYEPSL
ncbi:MAG: mitochondrial fission ELM1 family protein, partial [Rhodospirillales bacterium]|nr:mitochondrial fission ELM1 family protein [Rhodospirillales bacterium]